MNNAVEVKYNWTDHRALLQQMERGRKEFGKSLGQSIRWAAWHLAKTLGTSTKVSRKIRSIHPMPRRGFKKEDRAEGKKPFNVHFDKGRGSYNRVIWKRNITEVKKSPLATVRMRGLARAAWMWNIKKVGSGMGSGFASPEARAKAQSKAGVEQALRGDNPYVKMRSRVNYATAAMENGPQSIDTAMRRAAAMMAHTIDAKLQKAMKTKAAA